MSAEIRITDGDGRFELHAQLADVDRELPRKTTFRLVLIVDGQTTRATAGVFIDGACAAGQRPGSWYITGKINRTNLPVSLTRQFVAEQNYFKAIYNVRTRKGYLEPGTWELSL